ncbi:hypothetical protein KJ059_01140 [Myxococcota bacterium]|nr:hypothetical protein [Myxococcota bacterium]MCZ7618819.1 hypothetical protein [Myxococcota bacterium]
MDAEQIFRAGALGLHLLFDEATIDAAFEQDPGRLRAIVERRRAELQAVLAELLALDRADQARRFIAVLPGELQHVLVVLYFELLSRRLGRHGRTLH